MCNSIQMHLEKNWHRRTAQKQLVSRNAKLLTFTIVFECLLEEGGFARAISFPGSKFSRAKNARMEIEKILVEFMRRKREEMEGRPEEVGEEEEMLHSRLVAGLIRGEISEEEVVDNVVLLVFAAHDTSFAIAMTFRMLAQHPDCYSLLLQEHAEIMSNKRHGESLTIEDTKKMKYTWQVARERMRLFPPICGSFRKAVADIEYEGFSTPRGWKVMWTAYGTHYNEQYFQEPTKLDPTRFEGAVEPYSFLPFGGGPSCMRSIKWQN